jgi:small subunit ribosomal protein S16
MATRIRLQRHGKKGYPFYHVVVADSRAKRDGKFIEKLGVYNPNTNPATIDIDFDRTIHWVRVGAEMTDTTRAILSYKGVLYKNHLINGVKKGALTEEQVEAKFEAWLKDKEAKIAAKKDGLTKAGDQDAAARLAAEKERNEARAKELAAKNAPEVEEVAEEAEATAEETATAETETPAEETPAAEEATEAPEATEEEEKKENSAE